MNILNKLNGLNVDLPGVRKRGQSPEEVKDVMKEDIKGWCDRGGC